MSYEQDINILFNTINNMCASDAIKEIDKIKDNIALLSKLAYNSKFAKVQMKAKKKLDSIPPNTYN